MTDLEQRRAFEQEMLPHLDAMYSVALRLTRSPSDAEDLVQDALLRAYRFFDRYEPGTNAKAWLLRILTNTFINRHRRRTREREILEEGEGQPAGQRTVGTDLLRRLTDPAGEAERRVLAAEIRVAVESLPEQQRLMVLLADVEGLSYKEIAEVVGCPIGTVMSRLHRARKRLQGVLAEQAIAMGIVEAPEPSDASEAPVSLEAWRRRRAAGGEEAP